MWNRPFVLSLFSREWIDSAAWKEAYFARSFHPRSHIHECDKVAVAGGLFWAFATTTSIVLRSLAHSKTGTKRLFLFRAVPSMQNGATVCSFLPLFRFACRHANYCTTTMVVGTYYGTQVIHLFPRSYVRSFPDLERGLIARLRAGKALSNVRTDASSEEAHFPARSEAG